jgi:hypothetical protein
MSKSLWLLVLYAFRARYRKLLRGLATPKGVLLMLVGMGFFGLVIFGPIAARGLGQGADGATAPSPVQRYGPAGILAFALLSVFGSSKYRGIYFSPAEVDFLFPGPFARRELVAYRLATQFIHTILSVLFTSAVLFPYFRGFPQTVAGLFLAFTFLNLVQIAASLIAGSVEERIVARGRRFIGMALIAFAIIVFGGTTAAVGGNGGLRDSFRDILGSPAAGWVLLPLKAFSETLAAPDLGSFLLWGSGALAVDLAILFIVLRLDVDFSEASLETSRKLHQRIREMRRGGRLVTPARKIRLSIPFPIRWGGFVPIAWRQAQELVREMPAAAYLLAIFAVGAIVPIAFLSEGDEKLGSFASGASGLIFALPFILSNWFRFDFRADLDRMELLLGLPVRPALVAFGQVLVPALILTALQTGAFAAVLPILPDDEKSAFIRPFLIVSLPLNLLFVAIENLLFLLYPVRLAPSAPGDFVAMGRVLVAFGMKAVAFLFVVAAVFFLGFLVNAVTGSRVLAFVAGANLLALADWAAIALLGRAFRKFDVSRSGLE